MTLSRCDLTFGPYADAADEVAFAGLVGELRPTARVVETATGAVVVATTVLVVLGTDGSATISLPHTDQDSISGPFQYAVTWRTRYGDDSPGEKTFALPVAAGATADFDLLEDSPDAPGVAVPIAASVTQVQDAADSAAAAASSAAASAGSASTAAAAAVAAGQSASAAQASAVTARSDADASASSATGAQSAASQAQTQATSASTAASAAQTAATDAATQAGAAATSAANTATSVGRQYTSAAVVGDELILTRDNGGTTDAGNVRGPQGIQGLKGDPGDTTPMGQATVSGTINLVSTAQSPNTLIRNLSGNLTIGSISNGTSGVAYTTTLVLKQPATGGPFTVTWPATLEWPNDAAAPVMPTLANAEMVVHLFWTGLAWRAIVGGIFYP